MKLSTADKYFSLYIRLRDSDSNGILLCISCGEPVFWKKADAGHFIKRQHKATRFDEKNVNGQCRNCNWLKQGNDINYKIGLEKKYGPGIADRLELAGRRTFHLGKFELKIIADNYRMKFNKIKKEKNGIF